MSAAERLVGREPVLAAAGSVLRDALAGSGQLLMLCGEAGIGKTAVLTALIDQAEADCAVLRGSCWEGTGTPPYWPWTQILRATGLPAAELGEAGRLLETTTPAAESLSASAAGDAQFRLFDAVSRCLTGLARDRPVLVVLDDLHWADEPSLRLLGFLARALATSRVLLLGAYRDTEASAELLKLAGSAQQLTLTGLSPAEVTMLIETIAGPEQAAQVSPQLWQRSGGNPFFVRELTRLHLAQGPLQERNQIPASLAEVLRRRLARLSTACVRLLDWAAVAGRDVDPDLLTTAGAATGKAELLALLDEARRAGVIAGSGAEARFAHDLYRETILDGLSASISEDINFALADALQAGPGGAARLATHLLAAGPPARVAALDYSVLAAREATAQLGHEEACAHYQRALHLVDIIGERSAADRIEILLELAAALERAGNADPARERYLQAADAGRRAGNAVTVAKAALGVHSLGYRSGARDTELLELLGDAAKRLRTAGLPALRSQVLAALSRTMRHGTTRLPDDEVVRTARQAVELATAAEDVHAQAVARLALHDSIWTPGTALERLPVVTAMLDAATAAGDDELVANAHLLRATAMLELGDPEGREELLTYVTLAGELGHARGHWGALSRQAVFAELAGKAEEAARLADEALELGLAIGEPDAIGVFCTCRWALVALGVDEPDANAIMETADPLWPMFPLLKAWPHAARGDTAAAAAALGDFSVLDVVVSTGLEGLAVAAVVFAAVRTRAQRSWAYEQLRPLAGTHVVVSGCAAYHAAVDHHLGVLAAALGDTAAAEAHLQAAVAMHHRLGAAGWARLSEQALAGLTTADHRPGNDFRLVNDHWLLSFQGKQARLPDAKGLRDLHLLIGAQGTDVHVFTLLGHDLPPTGADPVLDDTAKARYKTRLAVLAAEIENAEAAGDADRSDRLHLERDALIKELAAATGLGGRSRLLGHETERARKTVSARVRDALSKIDRVHPDLARHLRGGLQMGTVCTYRPDRPITWTLN
jgi:tetratricopeptide (TPR) repeat protein